MSTEKLFTPIQVGSLTLPNRVVMAPLTRNRAIREGDLAAPMAARYYAQRATAGLIISEASQVMAEGKGYIDTPGIYSDAQVESWRVVTDAVHKAGGRIFLQLWHVGRVSHDTLQPGGGQPVAPSAIIANTKTFDGKAFISTSMPRALALDEIPEIVAAYGKATRNAFAAGFDGVEVHAANGYLIDQFLRDGTNQRTDTYGGSIANRARFLVEVMAAVSAAAPAGRVGIRLAPFSNANDITDSDPMATFGYAIEQLNQFGLAYLHMVEGQTGGTRDLPPGADTQALRRLFKGVYMANNGYDRTLALKTVAEGKADLIAFGRPYIGNPDLVERLMRDSELTKFDKNTLYGGGEAGYTDYPKLAS